MATASLFPQLFGRSPIKPIQKHIKLTRRCADELVPYFEAIIKEDWEASELIANRIFDLEHRADDLKHNIRANLPKSLFLPVPRSDLLELLGLQDMIANISKDIAGLILGRKAKMPEVIGEAMLEYVKSSVAAVAVAHRVVKELDELVDSGS